MKFLSEHKHVVLVALSAIALYAVVAKVLAHFDGVAHDQRVIAEQQVKADMEKAKLEAAQTERDRAELQNRLNALATSNADLKASLLLLRSQLQAQQARDAAMPPDALAVRWGELISLPGEIKPLPDGIVTSLVAAHATVAQLEEVPVLRDEVKRKDENSLQKDGAITKLQDVNGDLDRELSTCRVTVADKDQLCRAQLDEVKAKARKRERNWFVAGLLAAAGVIFGIKH